jgi:hypothetical protein
MEKFPCAECKEVTEHEFLQEKGEYNEIYSTRCKVCGGAHDVSRHDWLSFQLRNEVRASKAYLTKYPRIEPHSGLTVKSREHEKESVKRYQSWAQKEYGD